MSRRKTEYNTTSAVPKNPLNAFNKKIFFRYVSNPVMYDLIPREPACFPKPVTLDDLVADLLRAENLNALPAIQLDLQNDDGKNE